MSEKNTSTGNCQRSVSCGAYIHEKNLSVDTWVLNILHLLILIFNQIYF